MRTVKIRRQINDWRIAEADLSIVRNLHWDEASGGVQAIAPQPFIHGYIFCDQITGDIAHTCQHGPPPHDIKVVILKKDNLEIWERILAIAGPRPKSDKPPTKHYRGEADAQAIVDALLSGTEHPAIRAKPKGPETLYIINPKGVRDLLVSPSQNTITARSKKLKKLILGLMASNREFKEVKYGYMLAYKRSSGDLRG